MLLVASCSHFPCFRGFRYLTRCSENLLVLIRFSQGEVDSFRESFVSWFERQVGLVILKMLRVTRTMTCDNVAGTPRIHGFLRRAGEECCVRVCDVVCAHGRHHEKHDLQGCVVRVLPGEK